MHPQKYYFVFSLSQETLNALEPLLEEHPNVQSVCQNTGNWYSNGETGPEWFSMNVYCLEESSDLIEAFIREKIKEILGFDCEPNFIGNYYSEPS
jgi:hypothetical protein